MRILVVQTAFIGDVVLTTPFLSALKVHWPEAEIHVVATPQGCQILEGLPGLRCHSLDKKKKSAVKGVAEILNALREIEFELVFCVHRSLRSLWLARRVRARKRVAFASFVSTALGFSTVKYPPYDETIHYSDKPMALLDVFGSRPSTPRPHLVMDSSSERSVFGKLAAFNGAPYFVLSPFSVWGTKMWFADRFARAGLEIAKRKGWGVVVVGGGEGSQSVIGNTIREKIASGGGRVVDLVGRTSLGELKSLIAGAKLVLANDSAPVHLAAAFNVPTVAVFGPTVKKWGFFPLSERAFVVERKDVSCRPCHIHGPVKCPKGHFRCMDAIQVEDVVEAVQNLMR